MKLDDIEQLSVEEVNTFFKDYGIEISDDFAEFYAEYNGGCGDVGDAYIEIWRLDELAELNENYQVKRNIDNIVIFGSDGGDMAFGYDYARAQYLTIPFIGMGFLESPEYLGETYSEFFNAIEE